eukprot:CAMPEP_0201896650 /NCGR_PEP_ID=MMETSP0902-20130614/45065_1 /ASSEMBLY_ACC=CAM_ASM_000551 /TAXON_ID=420261 /ORGANISM="Thalassiosira antarctica, Strain CCMP982" /LENGTH=61 /DNA_ID=CAMNT_0048429299 /DNA_START=354 /DNA_END=539 /DNA_ORIENTATION=-
MTTPANVTSDSPRLPTPQLTNKSSMVVATNIDERPEAIQMLLVAFSNDPSYMPIAVRSSYP